MAIPTYDRGDDGLFYDGDDWFTMDELNDIHGKGGWTYLSASEWVARDNALRELDDLHGDDRLRIVRGKE